LRHLSHRGSAVGEPFGCTYVSVLQLGIGEAVQHTGTGDALLAFVGR
jgi:hypothetical protein